ncbi:MAG: sigma-54 dependent transcriptional regulator [Planctomycetota bacterium]|nr:sigma-54 dependent transcriptional regulator [Planctomycetota bacterium]MDA1177696.1 sigma-54 dependent transcriptional regulator [Planctomycetota bacterium]
MQNHSLGLTGGNLIPGGSGAVNEKQEIVLVHRLADVVASVANRLNQVGHIASVAHSELAFWQVMHGRVSVVMLEFALPGNEEMRLLQRIRERFPEVRIIVSVARGDDAAPQRAIDAGACDCLREPLEASLVFAHLLQATHALRLARDNQELRSAVSVSVPVPHMSAQNGEFRSVLDQVARAAFLGSAVLLQGESGTGKSILARLIHQQGPRSQAPFVILNCRSLPRELVEAELFGHTRGALGGAPYERPGRAEMAHGGTLFLDEVGELPLELQPRVLQLLQDQTVQRIGSTERKKIDVRIIASTCRDLAATCDRRSFLLELYRRLSVALIRVPSLKDRSEDIPELAASILARIALRRGHASAQLSHDAVAQLRSYGWPGNIRELEVVLERAAGLAKDNHIVPADLYLEREQESATDKNSPANLAGWTLAEVEKQAIVHTLFACKGNKARAARELGISEKSIYNKMKRLGISKHLVRAGSSLETEGAIA